MPFIQMRRFSASLPIVALREEAEYILDKTFALLSFHAKLCEVIQSMHWLFWKVGTKNEETWSTNFLHFKFSSFLEDLEIVSDLREIHDLSS